MQSFMDYNIGILEFPPLFSFFYEKMQKKGASDAFCAFPDTSGHVKSDQIHLFSSVQSMQLTKLLHLLLLLFDHLSYHLSTDGTSLA